MLLRPVGLDAHQEVNNMEDPYAGKYHARDVNAPPKHHGKAEGHQQRHRNHDTDFCGPGHSFAFDIALQIFLVQLCIGKPMVQPF